MKQKSLIVLSGVTVAAIAAALLASRGDDPAAADAVRGPLFPGLYERVNDVARVKLEKAGKRVTIERTDGAWQLADRGGYPAKFEEVKELVVRVAALEKQEQLTARRENHARLAVEWPTDAEEGSEAAEAGLVTLEDSGGDVLAALVVGKSEWMNSKPKVYVRKLDEDQVWLVAPRQSLDVVPEPRNWIEARFIELANDRVQRVTIEHADGEKVEIARSAADHTKFAVQNVPAGRAERYDGVANGPAQALSYVQLDDVRPVGEVDFTAEPVAKTRYRTVDGLEVLVETARFEDQVWMKVSASHVPPPAAAAGAEPAADDAPGDAPGDADGSDEPAADGDPAADGEPGAEEPATADGEPPAPQRDVAAEAAELNARLAPWAFQVGSYKTDVIARRMKDLLAEPPAPVDDASVLESMAEEIGMPIEEELPGGEPAPEEPAPDDDPPSGEPAPEPPAPDDTPDPEPEPE